MQNRPAKHEPQLSEAQYLHLLEMHAKLSENQAMLKAKKNEINSMLEDPEQGDNLIVFLSAVMVKNQYTELKATMNGINHQLIFHSQDAVAKLYASKSGMFTPPTSLAQSRDEKTHDLKSSQSNSLSDSEGYASEEHSHSQSDEEYSSPRMGRGSSQ